MIAIELFILIAVLWIAVRIEDVLEAGIHEELSWSVSDDDIRKIVDLVIEELNKRNSDGSERRNL